MMYDQQSLIFGLKSIVNVTAQYIKEEVGKVRDKDIEEKELNSLVSYVDKTAEDMLVERLGSLIPESGFITEEETEDVLNKEWTWIIDPLDGTTNYLHQIPHFCVSVALQQGKKTVLGVVHDVMRNEQFFAIRGHGAFLNEKAINVSKKDRLDQILVATGFPYTNDYNVDKNLQILKAILLKTRGMRRIGSAALDLAYVAAGRLGVYYETTLNAWDLAAGALLVEEAGGKVSDLSREDSYLKKGEIVASPPQFYEEIMQLLEQYK